MVALDYILSPFFLLIIYGVASSIKRKIAKKDITLASYFMKGLHLKIIGSYATGFIYWYYYGTGDSVYYFWRAIALRRYFFKEFEVWKQVFFGTGNLDNLYIYSKYIGLKAYDSSSFIVAKMSFLASFLSFGTYIGIALIFSVICYYGIWKFFLKTKELFPDINQKYLAYAILFVPSAFFWGSGLFKDTVTLGCTCLLLVSFHEVFIKRRKLFKNIIFLIICIYLIGVIKSYILMAMIPGLLLWVVFSLRSGIKNSFIRHSITPVFIIISIGLGGVLLQRLGTVFSKFNLENVQSKAEGMQRWHTARGEQKGESSSYSLGHVEFTSSGIVRKIPAAINVALFRPYIWEVRNPIMILAAGESIVFLGLFIWIFIFHPFYTIKQIRNEPFLLFCVIFTLIFAFAVGFRSYNFGALVRYKIPCLPTFGVIIAVVYGRLKLKKHKRHEIELLNPATNKKPSNNSTIAS